MSGTGGNYLAPNLAPGTYTVKASQPGPIFQPETVVIQSSDMVRDLVAQSCSYTLTPGSGYFQGTGGTGQILVTAVTSQTCEWTAVRDGDWITINSGSGIGDGNVQFTVRPNLGATRQGSITVGEDVFTITQASGCSFNLAGGIVNFPASGGTSSTMVTASDTGCVWNESASNYCMIAGLSGEGPGPGTLSYTVGENRGIARSAVINVGGQTITLNQEAASGPQRTHLDFTGDRKADIAVYRPSNGVWYVLSSDPKVPNSGVSFGLPDDIRVPADYDGDGKTDVSVYRPSNGIWYRYNSSVQPPDNFFAVQFGAVGDIPAPGDYDGDNRTDVAVYRPSTGTWYQLNSTTGFQTVQFGLPEDKPAPGDFDGDGKTDLALFRPSSGIWFILGSTAGFSALQFGESQDIRVQGDYDGDGKADLAVFRPSNRYWYRLNSSNGVFIAHQFGLTGDMPVPADYNGDRQTDIAVYRPSSNHWFIWSCTTNTPISVVQLGSAEDVPIAVPRSD